jgi:hypothetical protein
MRTKQGNSFLAGISVVMAMIVLTSCARNKIKSDFDKLNPDEKEQQSSDDSFLKSLSSSVTTKNSDSTVVSSDSGLIYPDPYCYPPYSGNFQQKVYLDKNKNGVADSDEELGRITAFQGNLSARKNYNYFSASAHPIHGPQPEVRVSKLFLYQNAKGAHLNFFHNTDNGGSEYNNVKWTIRTSNNFLQDRREFSDDRLELQEHVIMPMAEAQSHAQTQSYAHPDIYFSNEKFYSANWNYWSNTDGGVIGPFANYSESSIQIDMEKLGDIEIIQFASQDGQNISVQNSDEPMRFILKTIMPEIIPMYYTNGAQNSMANPGTSNFAETLFNSGGVLRDCLPPPSEIPVTLEFLKVTSAALINYDSNACGQEGMMCPAMQRASEFVVIGTGQVTALGLIQTQITTRFLDLYSDCGSRAKTAQMNSRGLKITGKTSAFSQNGNNNSDIFLTEITSCEVYY